MQSRGHQRPSYRVRREARGRECRGRVRALRKVEKGERRAGQRLGGPQRLSVALSGYSVAIT